MRMLEVVVVVVTAMVVVLVAVRVPRRGRWWPTGGRWPAPEAVLTAALLGPLALHLLIDRPRTVMASAYLVCLVLVTLLGLRAWRGRGARNAAKTGLEPHTIATSREPRAAAEMGDEPAAAAASREPRAAAITEGTHRTAPAARRGRRALRIVGRTVAALTGLVALAASAAGATFLPVFTLPTPAGPYAVGYTDLYVTDPERQEWATAADGDVREVVASVWYPADSAATRGARAEPLGEEIADAVSGSMSAAIPSIESVAGVLSMPLDHLRLIDTHSVRDAAPAPTGGSRFPVILYSPGLGSTRFENVSLMEDLASRGYVVVAVDHPYTSGAVMLSDGTEVTVEQELLQYDGGDDVETRFNAWVGTRAEDLSVVLDRLAELQGDPGSVLHDVVDLETVGAVGFSVGGDTVAQALAEDPRLDAGISLDGPYLGASPSTGVPVPYLNLLADDQLGVLEEDLQAERATGTTADALNRYRSTMSLSTGPTWAASIVGTNHLSHTMFPLIIPSVFGGEATGRAQVETVDALVADFFNHTLRGEPTRLLGHDSAVPLAVRFLPDPALPTLG